MLNDDGSARYIVNRLERHASRREIVDHRRSAEASTKDSPAITSSWKSRNVTRNRDIMWVGVEETRKWPRVENNCRHNRSSLAPHATHTIGAHISPRPRVTTFLLASSLAAFALRPLLSTMPRRSADRSGHADQVFTESGRVCTRLARCINNAYATPKKRTVRYYRTDGYRRSAIITCLLHKMKVSRSCFPTPTRPRRESRKGETHRAGIHDHSGLPDCVAKIVIDACPRVMRILVVARACENETEERGTSICETVKIFNYLRGVTGNLWN